MLCLLAVQGIRAMRSWVATARALPEYDAIVQFVIDRRHIVLTGTYDGRIFKSRWSDHSAATVCKWRVLDEAEARYERERVRLPRLSVIFIPSIFIPATDCATDQAIVA
jgi:hypothetical protein